MPSTRRYRQGWILAPALAFSAALQGGSIVAYEALKPEPPPRLRLQLVSLADPEQAIAATVFVRNDRGVDIGRCFAEDKHCRYDLEKGSTVIVDVLPGKETLFAGWEGCTPTEDDVRRCEVPVDGNLALTIKLDAIPDEVNVATIDDLAAPPNIQLPEPPALKPTPEEIEAEKLEEPPLEVALVQPPPEVVPPPMPPPPPPPEEKKPPEAPKEMPPPPNMRMVEVPDENEVEDAPDDATHLSDKNRDVAEEMAARETNLEKELKGEEEASAPSEVQSEEIGGEEADIAQLEEVESEITERGEESDHSGREEIATGAITGEAGDEGEEGEGEKKEPGVLSMRGIEGRGSVVDQGGDGKKAGRKGKEGVKTQLEFDDYERIVGKERADKERAIAKRDQSMKKGRYQKKMLAIKSALENFTPDVKPGNQTALKTRAHPFALYVARMHRRIHELWGFGFLEDLDGKSADDKMNDFDLFTSIEVSINPDGTVHKMTIAKTSGVLEFDVAALHTIDAAGPYGQTPEKIRSVDGRVYLRWGFYRNWRQCGTFNVEPYILTSIDNAEPLPEGMDTSDGTVSAADAAGDVHEQAPQRGDRPVTPEPPKHSGAGGDAKTDDRVAAAGNDREKRYAAEMWIAGFTNATVDRMIRVSAVPFYAGTEVAATTTKDLRAVYEALIVESGKMSGWELLTADEYRKKYGTALQMSGGALVIDVHAKERFGIVLVPTKSGEYRAQAVVR